MAIVRMRVPRKPYDVEEIETVVMHREEGSESSEHHPQFGSADPRRYQEMRDFYGAESVRKEMQEQYAGPLIHSFDAKDDYKEPSKVYSE